VHVQNTGMLAGSQAIELLTNGSTVELDNSGRIIGAIDLVSGGSCQVTNSGEIRGSVAFGADADYFDGRGGTVTGLVAGNGGNDLIIGGGLDDELRGDAGGDRLKGMAGDDTVNGGASRDIMNGGRGDDLFVFWKSSDSRPSAPDLIQGWDAGDVLDVSLLDANTGVAGQQHLVFGGSIAAGGPVDTGKIEFFQQGGDTFVVADMTGDHVADFEIRIAGVFTLNRGDFAV
jgi:Ca2+-binding RTX toxin-like protein